jgi:hypothetical protein
VSYRRSRRRRFLLIFLLAGKFSGFDPSVALAGNMQDQRRLFEAIADGIGDDWVGNDLAPVVQSIGFRE